LEKRHDLCVTFNLQTYPTYGCSLMCCEDAVVFYSSFLLNSSRCNHSASLTWWLPCRHLSPSPLHNPRPRSNTPPPHTHTHSPHLEPHTHTLLLPLPLAPRRDFLSAGTMAKGAAESGVAESYMCAKVARNPLVQRCCAAYLGEFEAQEGANNIQKGTTWLVRGGWGRGEGCVCWTMCRRACSGWGGGGRERGKSKQFAGGGNNIQMGGGEVASRGEGKKYRRAHSRWRESAR